MAEIDTDSLLVAGKDEIRAFADRLSTSGGADCWRDGMELSQLLRKKGRYQEAAIIARAVFDASPGAETLNLLLAAAVDAGDADRIKGIAQMALGHVVGAAGEPNIHLLATLLKAANRLEDDELFNSTWALVPEAERYANTYVAAQYLIFLDRTGRFEATFDYYTKLPPSIRESPFVSRYFHSALKHSDGRAANRPHSSPAVFHGGRTRTGSGHGLAHGMPRPGGVLLIYSGRPRSLAAVMLMGLMGIGLFDVPKERGNVSDIATLDMLVDSGGTSAVILLDNYDGDDGGLLAAMAGYLVARVGPGGLLLVGEGLGHRAIAASLGGVDYFDTGGPDWAERLFARLSAGGRREVSD